MLSEKEIQIIDLEEELEQWENDLVFHEDGARDARRNIARIKRRLSRLTPHTADAACAQADEDTGDNRGAADV